MIWLLWVLGWIVLAIGVGMVSGHDNDLGAMAIVLALGVIVSIVIRRLTAASRAMAAERKHVKLDDSVDFDDLEPVPMVALRASISLLVQGLFLCMLFLAAGYLLHNFWTTSPFTAYGIAAAAATVLVAVAFGLFAGWVEWDTRRDHERWRQRRYSRNKATNHPPASSSNGPAGGAGGS